MAQENPFIMSHVSIGTNDFDRAIDFYDKVFATIGARRTMELIEFGAVAYGRKFPEFWVCRPVDGADAEKANGTHFAFVAPSREAVHHFFDAAVAAGAQADGEPGVRPHYGAGYYGCFVRDLDGHKIEAMYWDETAGGGA